MTILTRLSAFFLATFIAAIPGATWADAGHEDGAPAGAAVGSAPPRFTAASETFELVGVLNGKQLSLYLDRAADNSPVKDAKLELELGAVKLDVKPRGEGEFEATLAQPLKPGVTAVTVTVVAGQETDLLAGEMDIREGAHTDAAVGSQSWKKYGIGLIAGLLTLAALVWGLRRVRANRIKPVGGAA